MNMDKLYRKVGRRYQEVGWEFTGFPANGYWQVVDGRQSLIVSVDHPRPLELIRYTQYVQEIADYILQKAASDVAGWSLIDAITWTCEFLEERAAENDRS